MTPRQPDAVVVAGLAALLPFELSTILVGSNGHNVRSVHLVAIIAAFVLLAHDMTRPRATAIRGSGQRELLVALGALASLLVLSTLVADGFVVQATMSARRLLTGIAIAALVVRSAMTSQELRFIAGGYVAGSTVAGALGITQIMGVDAGLGSLFWGRATQFGAIERLTLPFGHANVAATHLAVGLLLGVGLAATAETVTGRRLGAVALLVQAYALTLTLSRGPVAAAILGLVGLAVLARHRHQPILSRFALGTAVAVACLVAVQPSWHLRLQNPGPEHWYAVTLDVVPARASDTRSIAVINDSRVGWEGSPAEYLELRTPRIGGTADLQVIDLPALEPGQRSVVALDVAEVLSEDTIIDVWRPGEGRFAQLSGVTPITVDGDTTMPSPMSNGMAPRSVLWDAAWTLARDHPLTGVGPGNFRLSYQDVIGRPGPATSHAHSLVFEPLASWGAPAALLFWSVLAWTAVNGVRRARSTTGLTTVAALGAVIMIGSLDWIVASASGGLTLWLLVGLVNQPENVERRATT